MQRQLESSKTTEYKTQSSRTRETRTTAPPTTYAEKAAAEERLREQQERIEAALKAKELEDIRLEVEDLRRRWPFHLARHHTLPPDLLPLEKAAQLERWRAERYMPPETTVAAASYDQFTAEILSPFRESLSFYDSLCDRVKKATRGFSQFLKRLFRRPLAKILHSCKIHYSAPNIGQPGADAISAANQLLRYQWHTNLGQSDQSIFSVHSNDTTTTIQIGSGSHGSAYITFDGKLDPVALARQIMAAISAQIQDFFAPTSVVTVYDGELAELNPKHFLPTHRVVRSRRDNLPAVRERLGRVLSARTPRPEDTALHIGVPEDREQLNWVFKSDSTASAVPPDWDEWSPVAPLWREFADRRGFLDHRQPTSEEILLSLATKQNVIIIVAHADDKMIRLPAPPPKGSVIGPNELEAHKDAISVNKPIVYLFCCETAKVEGLASFADQLLDCGASAVIAPQTKIGAISSANLFDRFLSDASESGMLASLLRAESETGYREMEVYVG